MNRAELEDRINKNNLSKNKSFFLFKKTALKKNPK